MMNEQADAPCRGSAEKAANMYLLGRGGSGSESLPREWLTPERLVMYSGTIIVAYALFLGTWAWVGHGFTTTNTGRPGLDFSVFWAASHLALHGSPLQVYDYHAFIKTELALSGGFADPYSLPWLYPPAFLILVAPLSLLPLGVAYFLFIAASTFLFVKGTLGVSRLDRCVGGRRPAALFIAASPCVFVTAIIGQNSLLTAALAAFSLRWIVQRPVQAGICIGLLAIKPQLAVVFPFVLIASREWKVLAIAALTAFAVTGLGVLVCGMQSFHGFLVNASMVRSVLLDHGQHFWFTSPTPFSALRSAGVPAIPAYVAHAAVATVSVLAACHVWRSTRDVSLRASILVLSALIVSPYIWHYELVWFGIALACMTAWGLRGGWLRGEQAVLALGWLLPIFEHFNFVMKLPQIGPIVLLLAMLVILRRARVGAGAAA